MTATDTLNVRTVTVALNPTHPEMGSVVLTSAINSIGDEYWTVTSDAQAAAYYTGDRTATGIIGLITYVPGRGWYTYANHTGTPEGHRYTLPTAPSRATAGRYLMAWWNFVAQVERDQPGEILEALNPFELTPKHRRNLFR